MISLNCSFLLQVIRWIIGIMLLISMNGCDGTQYDNLFSPNWKNRHDRFVSDLRYSIGKHFPLLFCGDSYVGRAATNGSTVRYDYSYRLGCHYSCTVNSMGVIVDVSIDEAVPNACWTTLN